MDKVRYELVKKFLLSVALAIPLSAGVGIIYSFKFAGPIYRFKKYFETLANSRWDERCSLRKGDELWDVCHALNDGVDKLRDHIRESHAILQDTRGVLDEVSYTVDDVAKARIVSLKNRIEREERVWRERFPVPQTAEGAPAPQGDIKAEVAMP